MDVIVGQRLDRYEGAVSLNSDSCIRDPPVIQTECT